MTVPVGGTVALSAEPLGNGFTWHVLSYVQPSQVQYGSLSLPTTTVASLPGQRRKACCTRSPTPYLQPTMVR